MRHAAAGRGNAAAFACASDHRIAEAREGSVDAAVRRQRPSGVARSAQAAIAAGDAVDRVARFRGEGELRAHAVRHPLSAWADGASFARAGVDRVLLPRKARGDRACGGDCTGDIGVAVQPAGAAADCLQHKACGRMKREAITVAMLHLSTGWTDLSPFAGIRCDRVDQAREGDVDGAIAGDRAGAIGQAVQAAVAAADRADSVASVRCKAEGQDAAGSVDLRDCGTHRAALARVRDDGVARADAGRRLLCLHRRVDPGQHGIDPGIESLAAIEKGASPIQVELLNGEPLDQRAHEWVVVEGQSQGELGSGITRVVAMVVHQSREDGGERRDVAVGVRFAGRAQRSSVRLAIEKAADNLDAIGRRHAH